MTIQEAVDITEHPFDGINGWVAIDTFDELASSLGNRDWLALGYRYVKEAVAMRGSIWVYLEKL